MPHPEPTDPAASRLRFAGLSVEFGATRALSDLDLTVGAGEIVGLLGHNGAGKSTLLNVASGAVQWTGGSFAVTGQPVAKGTSPAELAARGLTIIHQEPALAANLSVLDNLFIATGDHDSTRSRRTRAAVALERVGLVCDLDAPVGTLSLGERQLVDLARGLLRGDMDVLLLDEPTAALGAAETAALHRLIREFATIGTGVVYVSHRLPDILDVCTRIVVLRGGELVMDSPAEGLVVEDLAAALAPELVSVQLEVREGRDELLGITRDRELSFRTGEVVGLFGMAAGEQFRILDALFGLGGRLDATLGGTSYAPRTPLDAIRRRVFLVPGDRERDGLIPELSAAQNVLLPWYRAFGQRFWVSRKPHGGVYERARTAFNVQGPGGEAAIAEFSGGNRQKHLLARWTFPQAPSLLLLAQPTQGVDVGAKQDIAHVVRELAADGACVLVASAESDEIAALCDRSYVIYGEATSELPAGPEFSGRLLAELLALADRTNAASAPLPA